MNCQEFRLAHLEFSDGTLAPEIAAEARSHLEVCTSCARFDCLVRRATLVARNLQPESPRSGAHARVMARVREDAGRRRQRRAALLAGAAIAASIAILAAAVGFGRARVPATPVVAMHPAAQAPAPVAPIMIPRYPAMRRDFSFAAGNPALSMMALPASGRARFADAPVPIFLTRR